MMVNGDDDGQSHFSTLSGVTCEAGVIKADATTCTPAGSGICKFREFEDV